MPKITTYQATGKADVLQLPAHAPVADFSAQYRAGRQIAGAGETLQAVGEKIQAQQDELDASALIGEYEGQIRALQLETDQETTDGPERMKLFGQKATKLQKDILGRAKNPRVGRAFSAHVGRNYPVHKYSYDARTLEYQVKQQFADLDEQEDKYSRLAAEAPEPADRDYYIKHFEGILDKTAAGGLVDPAVMAQRKQRFRERSQLDYMDILRMRDPDKLFELEAQGEFLGVDPRRKEAIMDRAIRERAARATQGQEELRRAMAIWVESIERETAKRVADGSLTMEWIEEYGYAVSAEKLTTWRKAYRDQQLGLGTGDPDTERDMERLVYNPKLNPRQTLERVDALFVAKKIGLDRYRPWIAHLNAEINRRDSESRGEQEKGETRVRELQARRATGYLDLAQRAFRTTGIVDFDNTSAEAQVQFQQEYMNRVDYYGNGTEDGAAVYRDALPRFITMVSTRMDTRMDFLVSELGKYKTRDALRAARSSMSEAEYTRLTGYLREYYGIQENVKRLEKIRKEAEGKGTK
jgi:hypothetical protein